MCSMFRFAPATVISLIISAFVNWEGGGGAYYEVTTAKRAIADARTGQWLAMGDTSTGDGTATLVDVNGDLSLTADYLTGNTNAFGLITLTEGTYQFESYMFEEG